MEQALGHVTHARNLEAVLARRPDVYATWLPVPFEVHGLARRIPLLGNNWSVRASWRARRALDTVLARGALDALVFHTQVTSLFSYGLVRRYPTVISLDATPINYDSVGQYYGHRPAGNGPIDRQKFHLNQRVLRSASWLVAWSDWARASLIRDYGVDDERIRVLAPGAAAAYFEIGRRRLEAPQLSVAAEPVRILFVGGDWVRKGGPVLLDAIADLLGDGCELDIVTGSPVATRPGVRVHRGLAPNSPELLQLFSGADLFVLPSHAECLAVALMEASASGLPIVTTDVAALREAVVPGESGLIVAPGDAAALRAAITTLMADPQRRRSMAHAANNLARRKFDADSNNNALLDLVVEAATERSRPRRIA